MVLKLVFCYLTVCHVSSASVSAVTVCKTQRECNTHHAEVCGICVDGEVRGTGQCVYPFPFPQGGHACTYLVNCDVTNCNHLQGQGNCKKFEGSFNCECKLGFYGDACEKTTPPGLSRVIPYRIDYGMETLAKPYQYIVLPVRCTCYGCEASPGKFFTAVTTGVRYGYYGSQVSNRVGCADWWPVSSTQHLRVRFPYLSLEEHEGNKILTLGNDVLGYLTTYEVQHNLDDLVISHRHLKLFVSYQDVDLVCVPVVRLVNCGSTRRSAVAYTRSSHITVGSSVDFVSDGRYINTSFITNTDQCQDDHIYRWKLWKNQENDDNPSDYEFYALEKLNFRPFTLRNGYYRILLEVAKIQELSTRNFAYCHFIIRLEPLVVVMEGGSDRTIILEKGLVLDARRSRDPNQPSDSQTRLFATWNCVQENDPNGEDICKNKTLPVSEVFQVHPSQLTSEVTYNIKLTVWTDLYDHNLVLPAVTSPKIRVSKDFVAIKCLLNCEGKLLVAERLFLKVESNDTSIDETFEWTYYEAGRSEKGNLSLIADEEMPNAMLIIKENSLDKGKHYTIKVRKLSTNTTAEYSFETEEQIKFNNNSCFVRPTSGIRGFTVFDIVCENLTLANPNLVFEFYDKYPEDVSENVIFSGRMLGTSYTGSLRRVRLTRGLVFVYILSEKGLQFSERFQIELSHWKVNQEIVNVMFHNLTRMVKEKKGSEIMSYSSMVGDVVPTSIDKTKVLDKLLNFITAVPASKTVADLKLKVSTIYNVLVSLNRPTQLIIETFLLKNTLTVVYLQAKLFRDTVSRRESLQGMSPAEVRQVTKYLINCMQSVLACRSPGTEQVSEFDYDLKTLYALMQSSNLIEDMLYLLQDILTFLQAPAEPPTQLGATNLNNTVRTWVMKNDNAYNITNYLKEQRYKDIPIMLSSEDIKIFENFAQERQGRFALRIATINDRIFWWRSSDVKSNFISVSPVVETENRHIRKIKLINGTLAISVNLDPSTIKSMRVAGNTEHMNTKSETFYEEESIKIHRFDPAPKSISTLKFLFPPTNGSLLVLVTNDVRPITLRSSDAQVIEETKPYYDFRRSKPFSRGSETFVYVAILPNNSKEVISYEFEVNNTLCQNWVRGQWSPQSCDTRDKTDLQVMCKCKHFSIFAAAFPVPPQQIDPFADAKLFLDVVNNPLVVSFVSAVLVLYLLLCVWAWCKGKTDRRTRDIIVLEDNFPGDRYPYLLAAYTSSRLNAGTTANVGVKLIGERAQSRTHILARKGCKVLKRNYDDWFLIFCPRRLGALKSVHVWHDDSGSSPDWFLSRLIVYDLAQNVEIIFIYEDWLALRPGMFPEATITPATIVEASSVKSLFVKNCVLGLRETHSLLSIFLRHPRSEISRVQRISVYMCFFMVAMLCSIMFYTPSDEGVDGNQYGLNVNDIYVTIESLLITLLLTFFVLFAFKKSYTNSYSRDRTRSTIVYKTSDVSLNSNVSKYTIQSQKVVKENNCLRFFTKTMKERPLVPAQLPHAEPVVRVRKIWLTIAWVSCTVIVLGCSYLVMLYGLKLGKVQSKKWLSSVIMTIGEDALLVAPVRIIIFALTLSVIFQKLYEEDTHRVTYRDARAVKIPNDDRYVEELLKKRRHSMYAPLAVDVRSKMERKKRLRDNWWIVIDFSVAVLFVGVISAVVFKLWSSQYYSNSQVVTLMSGTYHAALSRQEFFNIKYIEQTEDYLMYSFILSLYNTFWYNNMSIRDNGNKTYYSADLVHSMVGLQRLRQFRVVATKCELKYIKTEKSCIPHFDAEHEDKDTYSLIWQPGELYDSAKTVWPWKYTEKSRSSWYTMYRLYGASGRLYEDGGYATLLGPTMSSTQLVVLELLGTSWQDLLTKAVIVESTLYNSNVDLFSQVTIIVEYPLVGTIRLSIRVTSVESSLRWELWNSSLLLFIVYYTVSSGFLINRLGLMEFLGSSRNRTQLVVVFLGVLSVVLAMTHHYKSTGCYEQFVDTGMEALFDFDSFIFYFLVLQFSLSTLLAVAVFRTIAIFRGGRSFLNHIYTLYLAKSLLIWLTLLTVLAFAVQFPVFILMNIFSVRNINEILIDPKSLKYFKDEDLSQNYGGFLAMHFLKNVYVFFVNGLFIVVFMYYTMFAKTYKTINSENQFNMITFLGKRLNQTKLLIKKWKK